MADRNLLPKHWLEEYKQFLIEQGYEVRPGRGDFQIMQARKGGPQWHVIYERLTRNPHYTVPAPLVAITRRFIDSRHADNHPAPWFKAAPEGGEEGSGSTEAGRGETDAPF